MSSTPTDPSPSGETPAPAEGSAAASSLPLSGERVAFTGTLASMTHRQAAELVAQQGGAPPEHVSSKTTLLVVGEEGWPLEADGPAVGETPASAQAPARGGGCEGAHRE